MDVVDSITRSRMMSGIKGKDTKPEITIRHALHRAGFRYRLHDRRLPGRPDLVLPKYRAVIFVHGCFWHAHDCGHFKMPSSRTEFWKAKFESNVERDIRNIGLLKEQGWRVCIVWECSVRGAGRDIGAVCKNITSWLKGQSAGLEIGSSQLKM